MGKQGISVFRIVEVKEENRQSIIERLRPDLLHHLFSIYNLLSEPDKTSVYVAYDDNLFKGHLLTYRGRTLMTRLDGEKKSAHKLLELLSNENMILFCPPHLVDVVKEKFPHASCYPEYQMYVAKGEEYLISPNIAQRLELKHASVLAELYSAGESQFHRSEEACKKLLEKCGVYGVFQNDKLVSVAVAVPLLPEIGEIRGVLTHPNHRNKGFGTMATSAATKHILEHTDGANLYVAADNKAAIRVYEKLRYRKIDEWFWVDIGTGLKP